MTSSARHGVRSKIAFSVPMPPPECPAYGCSGGSGQQDHFPWLPIVLGPASGVRGYKFLNGQVVVFVGPRHDTGWPAVFPQRAIHRRAELFVIDDSVDAFAGNHLGQCRTGEEVLNFVNVRANPTDANSIDEAAMMPTTLGSGWRGLKRRPVALPRSSSWRLVQRAGFVDQPGRSGGVGPHRAAVNPMPSRRMAATIRR